MFSLISGGHICVPKLYKNMASSYKALQWCVKSRVRSCGPTDLRLAQIVYISVFCNIFIFIASSARWFPIYFFVKKSKQFCKQFLNVYFIFYTGADPGFFLGGGALISCSTSTPINHIVFFSAEYQLYQKTAGHRREGGLHTPCTLPLDPPLLLLLYIAYICFYLFMQGNIIGSTSSFPFQDVL